MKRVNSTKRPHPTEGTVKGGGKIGRVSVERPAAKKYPKTEKVIKNGGGGGERWGKRPSEPLVGPSGQVPPGGFRSGKGLAVSG